MSAEEEYEEGEEEIGGVGTTLGVGGTPKTKQIKVKVKKFYSIYNYTNKQILTYDKLSLHILYYRLYLTLPINMGLLHRFLLSSLPPTIFGSYCSHIYVFKTTITFENASL